MKRAPRRLLSIVLSRELSARAEAYSSADVARMSLGDLSEDDVEGIRTGTIENPTVSRVVALAEAFGVYPSYFLETGKKPALLGGRR